ncbi:hypothetical protein RVBP17_1270 [Pseudomonas phage sp. 30-3]|uniref:Uncharacterized protein n=1 Tax=Pseudomonas phage vB_PaeM_PA5oct TaxID=2163605 RepID=A0A4Y1LUN0_9CAUD|nr:hypothetical protein PQE65_gp267 [Pseudomonas phage vB_PaeM_PA5oct]WMI31761.1 hypothetical protein GBBBJNDB_00058 [Pseudomonas phage Callisto]WPK38690.1 hypothetical protein Cassandra_0014 [Pseudomonas phage Cassandra]WPK39211.1 hypothetical protein Deiofobo_0014 [Pseudomonas phage Deifobo]WPK39723.1 hypothetical protein ETTORE_0014 [Pseudomonas phage Ettore]WPK40244.1 hypothetical protein Paride_0014 [Pseudomonas phage Paride]VOH53797.1 hypothetical protein MIJ3_00058 [Pseudomonas phage v
MKILLTENESYELDRVPDDIEDIRYCILDCNDKSNVDFYFLPLIFLESFYSPAVVLKIGKYSIQMPLDWSILVCDEEYSDLEVVPLTSLNDRGFHTIVFNPLKHMVPVPSEITITSVFTEVKWYFPKLKSGAVLVIPLEDGPNPNCALFVKEGNKIPDPIDIAELFK